MKWLVLISSLLLLGALASAAPPKAPEQAAASDKLGSYNVIDVPVECPEGQAPDPNGKCRPIWPMSVGPYGSVNRVGVPCPLGQKADMSGRCRPIIEYLVSFLKMLLN